MAYQTYDDLTNGSVASLLRRKAIFDQFGQPSSDESVNTQIDPRQIDPRMASSVPQGMTEMPPQVPMPQGQMPNQPSSSNTDNFAQIMDYVDKNYHPEHTATDRLNTLLSEFPNQDDYKPSIARRLVSIGAGMGKGGMEAQNRVLDAPYTDELAGWKERTAPFQAAATLENQQNINERQLMTGMAQNAVAQRKADETQRNNDEKNRLVQQRNDIANAKAHNYKVTIEGSRVMARNPNPPFDSVDLGPSGGLDKMTELDIKGGYQVKAAEAAASGAMNRVVAGGSGVVEINGKKYQLDPNAPGGAREITGLPDGPATKLGTPKTEPAANPKNESIDINNKLRELYYNDAIARKYIEIDPNSTTGAFRMVNPSTITTNQGGREYEQVLKKLYPERFPTSSNLGKDINLPAESTTPKVGDRVGNTPPATGNKTGRTPQQQEQALQSGQSVLIQNAAGKQFLVDADKVEQYLASKQYTRVR